MTDAPVRLIVFVTVAVRELMTAVGERVPNAHPEHADRGDASFWIAD